MVLAAWGEWETTGNSQPASGVPWRAILLLGSIALIARYTLAARMFLFLRRAWPHARVASFEPLPGALPASFLWEVASHGFAFHAGEFARQDLVCGSLAAVIVVLLWSCVSGVIILPRAQSKAQYARQRRGEWRGRGGLAEFLPAGAPQFELSHRVCYRTGEENAPLPHCVASADLSAGGSNHKPIDIKGAARVRAERTTEQTRL